jgi:superfamily I DNA and/or RNA helicase
MNRYVSKFISDSFYQGKLQDNARIDDIIGNPDLYKNPSMGYLVFLHTSGNEEFENGSYQNMREVDLVVNVCEEIHQSTPSMDISNVGVISPYSRQVYQLREKLKGATKEVSSKLRLTQWTAFKVEKRTLSSSLVSEVTRRMIPTTRTSPLVSLMIREE